ncbi:MAG: SMP-30/gluconolactonase/LRE family protein [Alkalispirochaeta sp.]
MDVNTVHPDYRIVSSDQNTLGEGPLWDARSNEFVWVAAYRHGFYTAAVDRSGRFQEPRFRTTDVFTVGITPWGQEAGSYLLTGADGLYRWHDATATKTPAADLPTSLLDRGDGAVPSTTTHRFNDVTAGPGGEFFAGIMPWHPDDPAYSGGGGALVRFDAVGDPAAGVPVVVEPAGLLPPRIPNGMGFSPATHGAPQWFYFTDSLRRRIYRMPYTADASPDTLLGPAEVLVDSTDRAGVPDGLTVAADGSIFSARWGGGCIDRYDPEGVLLERYAVPMRQPSSIAFGGPHREILLVTSATEHLAPHEITPTDGITIALELGVRGQVEYGVRDTW